MNQGSPWARQIATSFRDFGCRVDVLSFPLDREGGIASHQNNATVAEVTAFRSRIDSFHEIEIGGVRKLRYFLAVPRFRALLRTLEPDVVLCLYGGGQGVLTWLSGFRPFVLYLVGSDVLLSGRVGRFLNRFVIAAAATVVANGRNLAAQAERQAPGVRVEPLLFGIDTELFRPAPRSTVNPPTVVCARSFQDVYDNETVIRALSLLSEGVKPFGMSFIAGGEQLEACVALADRMLEPDRRSRVTFHGGMDLRGVASAFARADVYISMSKSDGMSTSLLEAMACGLVPIVSDIPANRELLSAERGYGILVPVGDAPALAAALESVLGDLDRHRTRAAENRALVCDSADGNRNRAKLLRMMSGA